MEPQGASSRAVFWGIVAAGAVVTGMVVAILVRVWVKCPSR